jgi:hypothetical protein
LEAIDTTTTSTQNAVFQSWEFQPQKFEEQYYDATVLDGRPIATFTLQHNQAFSYVALY